TGTARVTIGATNSALKGSVDVDPLARSGRTGDTGPTGAAAVRASAGANANSGAQSHVDSLSGDTGDAANVLLARLTAGRGGPGGDIGLVTAGDGGKARLGCVMNSGFCGIDADDDSTVVVGPIVGGDAIASASSNGGAGGGVQATVDPNTTSGDSGASTGQSSGTNTGDTGGSSSTSVASPSSATGSSGSS